MVRRLRRFAVIGLLGANAALADHDYDRGHGYGHRGPDVAYGRVIDVDPIIRYVAVDQPRQECRDEYVRQQKRCPLAHGRRGCDRARRSAGSLGRQWPRSGDRGRCTGWRVHRNQRAQPQPGLRELFGVERFARRERAGHRACRRRLHVTYVYQGRRLRDSDCHRRAIALSLRRRAARRLLDVALSVRTRTLLQGGQGPPQFFSGGRRSLS